HSLVILVWSLVISAGCDRTSTPSTTTSAKSPRIASLVPAATDLLIGMGAADHLVAVSNWETNRPEIASLPRVGDYQTTDWEKLAELKPDVMVIFMSGERMPAGIQQRADQLHIKLVNVKPDRLDEVFSTIDRLGDIAGERAKSDALKQRIQAQLDAVAKRVAGKPPVPTLVARDEEGFALVAGDTFVDSLLTIAGGKNVASDFKTRYPNVDRERVIELAPAAIIQLIPDATPQVIDRARQTWQQVSQVPAVRDGRVYILTDWYVLQPGSHVGDLAEKFAEKLHPG
ncbi:MAG TPA: helical backbone metal receptor, partial [Tepidisphaeraceae bacterium]